MERVFSLCFLKINTAIYARHVSQKIEMSHGNTEPPLQSEAPRKKKLKKVGALRNAFILGALWNFFMASERYVVSRIMVRPLTGGPLPHILLFQKTIPNHFIILAYFFVGMVFSILNKHSRIFERKNLQFNRFGGLNSFCKWMD